jgi:hypothetical protein
MIEYEVWIELRGEYGTRNRLILKWYFFIK